MRAMRATLVASAVVVVLLATSVAPALAAGPRWGAGRGPGAGIAAAIPADVHKAIEAATQAAAARVLKITPAELEKERAAGKTMAYLAGAKGVPPQTVWNAMQNARKYAINQAAAAGKITKAQADALLQAGPRFGVTGQPGADQRPGGGPRGGRMRDGRMHRFGPGR